MAFLEALVKYRVNFAPLVPPIIQFLARHPLPLKYDLSSIKVIFSGAAPLDAETQAAVQARLPGCSVRQGYGLTEASPVSHMPAVDDILPGSIGRLVANMEAAVQAPDGRMQPPGKKNQGELLLRGPNVMVRGGGVGCTWGRFATCAWQPPERTHIAEFCARSLLTPSWCCSAATTTRPRRTR